MLPRPVLRLVSSWLPEHLSGRVLHRRALELAALGRRAEAESRFEAAAEQYRREGEVQGLARLRVHQLMVRAGAPGGSDPEAILEIVRRLHPLDTLESLSAPFEPMDARTVLSEWLAAGESTSSAGVGDEALEPEVVRAA